MTANFARSNARGRTGDRLIASTKDISLVAAGSLAPAPPKHSFDSALRACRAFFDWHPLVYGICLAVGTAAATLFGIKVFASVVPATGGWAICTPLNGAILAVLLISRRRVWPWIMAGYVAALLASGALLGAHSAGAEHTLGLKEICGNLAELAVAAFALPPYRNLKQWLLDRRLLPAFAGYAVLLGPALLCLTVAQRLPGTPGAAGDLHADFWERARTVGSAEALGVALMTPLMLVLLNRKTYTLLREAKVLPGTLGLLALLGLMTWVAFTGTLSALLFIPYAALVLIAFRRGFRGSVCGTAVLAGIVIALGGHTPLLLGSANGLVLSREAVIAMQSYLGLAVLVVFPLSVTLVKRRDLEFRLGESQEELDRLKSLDRLTGVANRKRFDLVLAREWQRGTRDPKPIALLMIDADFFKQYNECYGTQAGDECLRLIATRMADQPHRAYDLVSRFQGGRFSVLLPGASGDAVKRIAEEFRAEIAALEWPHERSTFERVTVSVGWASMMPATSLQPQLLIAAAEEALAAAKAKGRNRVEGFSGSALHLAYNGLGSATNGAAGSAK